MKTDTIELGKNILKEGIRMKDKKKLGALIALLIVLVVGLSAMFLIFSEKPTEGNKIVTIEVINQAKNSVKYEVKTSSQYLKQAMEEVEGLEFSGTEGPYGLMIDTINGEFAEYNTNGAYWSFYVNGEYCNYGISEQPIEDGDAFQIIYTKQ